MTRQLDEKFKFLIVYHKLTNNYNYYIMSEEGFNRVMWNKDRTKRMMDNTPIYIKYAGNKVVNPYLTYIEITRLLNNEKLREVSLFGTNELDLRDEMIILNNCKGELNETEYKFE